MTDKMTTAFERAFAFSITPFTQDDAVDESSLRQHLQRLADAGVGVYLGSPGGGEGNALSLSELRRVYEIGVEELQGRVPVYASGFEPRSAAQLIEVGQQAVAAGIEAMQIYALDGGHGMVPTDRELELYFRDVLEAVDIPVVIVSHYKAGYRMPLPMLARLIDDYPNIVAINFVQNDVESLVALHDAVGSRIRIQSGGVRWGITNLGLGGSGFNSSEANIMPRTAAAVVDRFHSGDVAGAVQAHTDLLRLTHLFKPLMPTTPRPMKTILKLLGLPGGYLRRPYLAPEPAAEDAMAAALKEMDILGIEALA